METQTHDAFISNKPWLVIADTEDGTAVFPYTAYEEAMQAARETSGCCPVAVVQRLHFSSTIGGFE